MRVVVFSLSWMFLIFLPSFSFGGDEHGQVIVTATFTATTVCQGIATEFTNNSTTQSGSIVANIWDFGDGNGSSVTNPEHTYASSGTFTVTLTVINSQGDVDEYSDVVTIHPSGTLNFLITSVNNCETSQFTFNNLSNIVTGNFTSYTWDFGDGNNASGLNSTHTYATDGVYTVTLTTLTNHNCGNSFQNILEVYPNAAVDFEYDDECEGTEIRFVNNTTVSTGIVNYTWDFGDTETSTQQHPSHLFAGEGGYSVELTATTEKGCVTDITKSVTVFPAPSVTFAVSDHCFDSDAIFNNTSTISSGTLTHAWDFGDGSTSSNEDPVYRYNDMGNYLVTLTVESDKGCLNTLSKNLYVNAKPIVDFNFDNECLGEEISFVNNSTTAEGVVNYTWSFGDTQTSTDINPTHAYAAAGDFTVELTATTDRGCSTNAVQTATVFPVPLPSFTVADHCFDSDVMFENQTTIASGTLQYAWDLGDGNSSSSEDPTHRYADVGNYGVELTATSDKGCVKTFVEFVSVNPKPIVNFSFTNVCLDEEATFVNESTIAEGEIGYVWSFGDAESSTEINPFHEYGSAGNFDVELTATTDRGCSTSAIKQIEIYPVPVPSFVINDHCFGSDAVFDNQSSIASGTLDYTWTFGDGNTTPDEEPVHLYADVGNYEVILSATSNNGCTKAFTEFVSVNPKPLVDFSYQNVCHGTSAEFLNNSTVAEGSVTYAWDFGDSHNASATNPLHNFENPGDYNVELTASSERGCSTSLTRSITIYPMPVPDFLIADHCFGSEVTFENQSAILTGTMSYDWELGNGTTSGEEHPVYTYPAVGNYKITLTADSDHGCTRTISKYVYVNAKPIVNFTFVDICLGEAATFLNNSIPGGEVTYSWQFGDDHTSAEINAIHTYERYGTFDVTLNAITPNAGCATSLTQQIVVNQTPIAGFQAKDNCLDSLIHFTNTSFYEGEDITYKWEFGNGLTSTDFSPDHGYTSPQTYVVSLTAQSANGCSDIFTKPVKVFPLPVANFAVVNVCDTETAVFENLSSISSGSISYEWSLGDEQTSLEAEPEHVYESFGIYPVTLTVTSDGGCTAVREKLLEVFPLPETDFIAPAVCDTEPVVFTNTSFIESGSIVDFRWDFGDQTNSIVKNPVKEYLDDGTYLVKLTSISDQRCETSATKQVTVYPPVLADFSVEDVCFGESIQTVNTSSIESGTLTFEWDFGDSNTSVATAPAHAYEQPGVYSVQLKVIAGTGCLDSVSHAVAIYSLPLVNAGEDKMVSKGYSVQLDGSGALEYLWSPVESLDNSVIQFPSARPMETTDYVLTGTDRFGCESKDTVTVLVQEEFRLVATNVLTPDENGKNDTWVIENVETFGDVHVRVYNRWGKLVFDQTAYQNDWKGTTGKDILPDGAYYYYITFDSSDKVYKGALTILRNGK